jgi:hypothetical protein
MPRNNARSTAGSHDQCAIRIRIHGCGRTDVAVLLSNSLDRVCRWWQVSTACFEVVEEDMCEAVGGRRPLGESNLRVVGGLDFPVFAIMLRNFSNAVFSASVMSGEAMRAWRSSLAEVVKVIRLLKVLSL